MISFTWKAKKWRGSVPAYKNPDKTARIEACHGSFIILLSILTPYENEITGVATLYFGAIGQLLIRLSH
jgi:hypothetical protein